MVSISWDTAARKPAGSKCLLHTITHTHTHTHTPLPSDNGSPERKQKKGKGRERQRVKSETEVFTPNRFSTLSERSGVHLHIVYQRHQLCTNVFELRERDRERD
jgi:hypothetical protein